MYPNQNVTSYPWKGRVSFPNKAKTVTQPRQEYNRHKEITRTDAVDIQYLIAPENGLV